MVTGHTGFKGSWLSVWLNLLGAEVSGIALDPVTDRDLFILSGLKNRITDYRTDIRDFAKVESILEAEKPQSLFHLAAQPLVLDGYRDPVRTFETNLMGTVNILEACRKSESINEVIIITTDKVYENKEHLKGYNEEDTLGGHDPYSASKAAAELAIESYWRSFYETAAKDRRVKALCSARAGNVIGGGDWAVNRLIPDSVRALEENEPVILRNPASVRPWQHVLEPLSGYLLLCSKAAENPGKYSGAWNFGPHSKEVVSAGQLVDRFLEHWGTGKVKIEGENQKFHEAGMLLLDSSKARDQLGWKPLLDFSDTLKLTAEWYRDYRTRDVYGLCTEQIEYYTVRWRSGN